MAGVGTCPRILVREDDLKTRYPRLKEGTFQITSPATDAYNCVAWAAGDDSTYWAVDPWGIFHWPVDPGEDTLEGWVHAFSKLGYVRCEDAALAEGLEKIAIYGTATGPLHIARQLPSGRWTSKLGRSEDIEHEVEGLVGDAYGEVLAYLCRQRPS